MATNTITQQTKIDATQASVWFALTDAAAFGEWFQVVLDGPFLVGETTTGKMTYPGHEGVPWISVTETMDPLKRFDFRWPHVFPGDDIRPDTVWLTVSFTLEPHGDGTLLTVKETGFQALPKDQRISMLRDNEQGWEIQSANVKRYVEG